MRIYILRALLQKEIHRHLANRGGIALAALLIVAALLLSVFNPAAATGAGSGPDGETGGLVGGIHSCYIEYADETRFIRHLAKFVPADLQSQIVFRQRRPEEIQALVQYSPGVGAITINSTRDPTTHQLKYTFGIWHPRDNPEVMARFEQWFWKAARNAFQLEAVETLRTAGADPGTLNPPDPGSDDLWAVRDSFRQLAVEADRIAADATRPPVGSVVPTVEIKRSGLAAKVLDIRSAVATGMLVFALYFTCVYLLPTLNCEERERGVLLAQALSPASPAEILAAKFLFYPFAGVVLAAILAGIYKPGILSTLFFWLSLFSMACGFLGIGMTVATLAKTQRAAFLGSMCYLLSVALILMICQQNRIPLIPYLALEFHGPRILHAAITGEVEWRHWLNLLAVMGLAIAWILAAGWLFRRRGWQ